MNSPARPLASAMLTAINWTWRVRNVVISLRRAAYSASLIGRDSSGVKFSSEERISQQCGPVPRPHDCTATFVLARHGPHYTSLEGTQSTVFSCGWVRRSGQAPVGANASPVAATHRHTSVPSLRDSDF